MAEELDPIVAVYEVKVTVRAPKDTAIEGLTIDDVTSAIEDAIDSEYSQANDEPVTVTATATRSDK